ncbi:winged helix-turn-helix domain-containing protein [Stakelama saccharophila]|uniref:Winged helix-turn-helix domain-containing protein n=1 Tax=Stakelama saccharophila TaxID=3075605 RepID=A0ABZ0BB49_9SPHN|nr:winged helix-turn-helix domain-containing protein [Stakelama sp. W311]WNO53906.1 winged helix-turn-helix domain-containing protein [Stakelama sp. W311]
MSEVEMPGLAAAARSRSLEIVSWHGRPGTAAALLLRWDDRREPVSHRLRRVRAGGWQGPAMTLTRLAEESAIAAALDAGADDAACEAAGPALIAARLAALLRNRPPTLCIGDLVIEGDAGRVMRAGRDLPLLPRERALLLHLARQAGGCVSRRALLRDVWGLGFDPGTNVVQVHMSRLRAKLDRGFATPLLHTVKGKGYRLGAPDAA